MRFGRLENTKINAKKVKKRHVQHPHPQDRLNGSTKSAFENSLGNLLMVSLFI